MNKQLARIILVSLFAALALVLPGCGGKKESAPKQEPAAQEVADTQEGRFEGREARDISEMKRFKEKALENAKQRKSVQNAEKDEVTLVDELDTDFENANKKYRKGDYAQAQKGYEKVLKTHPRHYGANVNLTLALLQQEKGEDALVQALTSLSLFPGDDGIPLNVQTAAVACGFTAEDALKTGAEVVSESEGGTSVSDKRANDLAYNRLWDRIETELWAAAHAADGDKQSREKYEALHKELSEEVEKNLSDDKDAQALLAYLEAVGKQLEVGGQGEGAGDSKKEESSSAKETKTDSSAKDTKEANETKEAKIDFSTVEPHVGLPYVVADDENCTVVFTGYHMASDKPVAEFSMLNKTADKRLRMEAKDARANGVDIENFSGAYVYVSPGEQGSGWGSFFGKEGDNTVSLVKGDLKELTCAVTVSDVTGGSSKVLATLPLSWKADESGKGEMKVNQKVIDEKDVFSLTVTGVRGASDDVVGIEYSSGNPGKGKISFDSKGDWQVNGVDMELLGAGLSYDKGNGSHHFILLKAKNPGALGNDPVKTVTGTLVVKDADGKELASKKLEL